MKPPIVLSSNATNFEKLYAAADALNIFFKEKPKNPFEIMNRLIEEAGEIATEVNVLENNGIKHLKSKPSKQKLASEIKDLLQVVFQLIRYYEIEAEVEQEIVHSLSIAISKNLIHMVE